MIATAAAVTFALLSFLVGCAWVFVSADMFVRYFYEARMVALTHLFTLGWVSLMIVGVLRQLAPVAFGLKLRRPNLIGIGVILWIAGVIAMIAGFATLTYVVAAIGTTLLLMAVITIVTVFLLGFAGVRRDAAHSHLLSALVFCRRSVNRRVDGIGERLRLTIAGRVSPRSIRPYSPGSRGLGRHDDSCRPLPIVSAASFAPAASVKDSLCRFSYRLDRFGRRTTDRRRLVRNFRCDSRGCVYLVCDCVHSGAAGIRAAGRPVYAFPRQFVLLPVAGCGHRIVDEPYARGANRVRYSTAVRVRVRIHVRLAEFDDCRNALSNHSDAHFKTVDCARRDSASRHAARVC